MLPIKTFLPVYEYDVESGAWVSWLSRTMYISASDACATRLTIHPGKPVSLTPFPVRDYLVYIQTSSTLSSVDLRFHRFFLCF